MWRYVAAVAMAALALTSAAVVWAQFFPAHQANGEASTAASAGDVLYICQPSGYTTNPICPIDTSGADEAIFVGSEDMVPGNVRWQKIRIKNTGSESFDILDVTQSWAKVIDPGDDCAILPEGVYYYGGVLQPGPTVGPGIELLGQVSLTGYPDPIATPTGYSVAIDHPQVAGSYLFTSININGALKSAHVPAGSYNDFLLGIRLPADAPAACMGVVWQLTTTWSLQIHLP